MAKSNTQTIMAVLQLKIEKYLDSFQSMLDEGEKTENSAFIKSNIKHEDALSAKDSKKLESTLKNMCKTLKHLNECTKTEGKLKQTQALFEQLEKQVENGFVDIEKFKTERVTIKDHVEATSNLLGAGKKVLAYSDSRPDLVKMNHLVREFREDYFNVLEEVSFQQDDSYDGVKANKAPESFNDRFSSTQDAMKKAWSGSSNTTKTEESESSNTAVGFLKEPEIRKIDLHKSASRDSEEAHDNITKQLYYHLNSVVGLSMMAYIKNVAFKPLIQKACLLNAPLTADLTKTTDIHIAEERSKNVIENFDIIFEGMDSIFSSAFATALNDMNHIGLSVSLQTDLSSFTDGITEIYKASNIIVKQHADQGLSALPSIDSLFDEYCADGSLNNVFSTEVLGQCVGVDCN